MRLKPLQKEQLKKAEATSNLISNKIADKITKVSKISPQNNSETITNEHDKEVPIKYICLQKKDRKLMI